MNSEIELRDHVFVGPLRRSVNNARHVPGASMMTRARPGSVSVVAPWPDRSTSNCFRRFF